MVNIIPFLMKRGGKATMNELCLINKDYSRWTLMRNIRKLEQVGFIGTERDEESGQIKKLWLTEKESDCTIINWHCKERRKRK